MNKEYNLTLIDVLSELEKDSNKKFISEYLIILERVDNKLHQRTRGGEEIGIACNLSDIFEKTHMGYKEYTPDFAERVENGDNYYFIRNSRFVIDSSIYYDCLFDKDMIKLGNFFETEEEAQEKLDKILEILK